MRACKLCKRAPCEPVRGPDRRTYFRCPACGLTFVPPEEWLSAEDERQRYAHHDNTAANDGYVAFLSEVVEAALSVDLGEGRILDFGCGERAVLTGLFEQRGLRATAYDPLYGIGAPAGQYDLVVLCEVIEHLRDLRAELQLIAQLLAPGASVLVRTRTTPSTGMANWWYARDPTHINFFGAQALEAAAALVGCPVVRALRPDIFLFEAGACAVTGA